MQYIGHIGTMSNQLTKLFSQRPIKQVLVHVLCHVHMHFQLLAHMGCTWPCHMAVRLPHAGTALDEDELPDYIQQRCNQDLCSPGSQTWGPELLGFYQQATLLILNGRTPGDEYGQFTFQNAKAHVAPSTTFSHLHNASQLQSRCRFWMRLHATAQIITP